MTAEPRPIAPASLPLHRNGNFLLLWMGQVVSAVGTQNSQLAFPLLVLSVTHSAAITGLITAIRGIPFIVLTLPGGALVDRWNRKLVMIVSDAGRAIALGSIPVAYAFGRLSLVQLALATLIEGTLYTFFNVAEPAALPNVVARERIPDAVALNNTIDSVSVLAGPSLAGVLYAAGRALPFAVNAVTYAASVISLFFIRVPFQTEKRKSEEHIWHEIRAGIAYTWNRPVLRFMAGLVGWLNLFSMGYPLLMIVRAHDLHAGAIATGLLFASGGVGGIAGTVLVFPIQRYFRFGTIVVASAWIWALTWIPYALAPNVVALAIANAVGWLIIPILMGAQYSFRIATIPDSMQGRSNAVIKLVAFGTQPVSLAMTGALIQAYGPIPAIYILLVPQVIAAAITTIYAPLRRTPYLKDIAIAGPRDP
ncbi:MAG TPA: MFS transporter [Chloroflexota bacterium]|nr:MFS transporter [Chloroflexota bacterium]